MIAHQGENVIIGTVFKPISGEFNLANYTIRCVVSDINGKEKVVIEDEFIVRNNADSIIACTIPADKTEGLNGLYFVSFELWSNNDKVLSNEVEQITIIA